MALEVGLFTRIQKLAASREVFFYLDRKLFSFIIRRLWLLTSKSQPCLAEKEPIGLTSRDYPIVKFIRPDPSTNKILYPGSLSSPKFSTIPDLADLSIDWLENEAGYTVEEITPSQLVKLNEGDLDLVVTYISPSPQSLSSFSYFYKVSRFARKLASKRVPVVCLMPDTFYPDAALLCNLLVSKTQGASIFLQSTHHEASLFGYKSVIDKVFWPWPSSRVSKFEPLPDWLSRKDLIVLAGKTGDLRRQEFMRRTAEAFSSGGPLKPTFDGEGVSAEEYRQLLKAAKLCITTNWVQDQFVTRGHAYRKRVSTFHTTGRVWEAFAAGVALATHRTNVLDGLGFVPGVHYFEIDPEDRDGSNLLGISDSELKNVANQGHLKFLQATSRPKFFD